MAPRREARGAQTLHRYGSPGAPATAPTPQNVKSAPIAAPLPHSPSERALAAFVLGSEGLRFGRRSRRCGGRPCRPRRRRSWSCWRGDDAPKLGSTPCHLDQDAAKRCLLFALGEGSLDQSTETVLLALNTLKILDLSECTRAGDFGGDKQTAHGTRPCPLTRAHLRRRSIPLAACIPAHPRPGKPIPQIGNRPHRSRRRRSLRLPQRHPSQRFHPCPRHRRRLK